MSKTAEQEILEGTKGAPAHLGRVCILGLGKSGKSAARYCAELLGTRVSSLFVAAGQPNEANEAFLQELQGRFPQLTYAFGDDAIARFDATEAEMDDLGTRFDLCIASPGIPYWHELYQTAVAASGELISEVEFSWRESAADSTWVAITGTNGKTTTTSLAAHVLCACGRAAQAVGNIGEVCLDAVQAGDTQVYVAEVSSYQLASTPSFAPDVAVMLNITPDHVHWHKTFEAYRDAKFALLDNMARTGAAGNGASAPGRVAILDAVNDVVRERVRALRQMQPEERGFAYIPMGTADGIAGDMRARCGAENAAFLAAAEDTDLAHATLTVAFNDAEHVLCRVDELQIQGEHNASNALAAAAVAVALGADDAAIVRGLKTFEPLVHRIEPCGSIGGVDFYNDSKATNVDATLKALQAFPGRRLIVLLGGDDKGTDLQPLVAAAHEHAGAVVCFGEAGPRFHEAFAAAAAQADPAFELLSAEHLADALEVAAQAAGPGDVVILSPACASFDEFRSFEERGDVFKALVAQKMQEA